MTESIFESIILLNLFINERKYLKVFERKYLNVFESI